MGVCRRSLTMYFLSTLHPRNSDIHSYYREMYFSRPDKEEQIKRFYQRRVNIPLCLDHCGGESAGVVVSPEERIGEVLDLFINRKGEMMAKLKLDDRHPAYRKIKDGIHNKREKWGVSVWIQHVKDLRTGRVTKDLGHVALTTDPLFADQNTFLHWYGVQESGIDKVIAKDFYQESVGQSFSSREMKLKLESMKKILNSMLFNSSLILLPLSLLGIPLLTN